MTRPHWIASLLIALHLVAITVAAIPDPRELNPAEPLLYPHDDADGAPLTPVLDRSALWLSSMEPRLFRATQPLRIVTRPYVSMGLRQQWNMFANPLPVDQYVRLDYYVSTAARPDRIFQELVLPAQHEDRVRLVHQFRDKAILNALETFYKDLESTPSADPLPRDFLPLIRYFRERFRARHLRIDEQVARTHLWYGAAIIPPRGQTVPADVRQKRLAVLTKYFDGTIGVKASVPYPKRGSAQREADILWTLEYIDQP